MQGQNARLGLLNDPRMAALYGAGAGLLNAAGPKPYKVGWGEALGQGLGGALSGYMGAQQFQSDQEMRDLMSQYMRMQMQPPGGMQPPGMGMQQPRPMALPISAMMPTRGELY